jgi:cold shock CspA family protein
VKALLEIDETNVRLSQLGKGWDGATRETGWIQGFDCRKGDGFISIADGGPLVPFSVANIAREEGYHPQYLDRVDFSILETSDGQRYAADLTLAQSLSAPSEYLSELDHS